MYYTKRAFLLGIIFFMIIGIIAISDFLNSRATNNSPTNINGSLISETTANQIINKLYYEHAPNFPLLTAESFLIADIHSGEIWKEKNEKLSYPIASLTKLMTSLLFAELLPQEEWYRVSGEAKKTVSKISQVPEGYFVSARDIIRLMLMESDNDAALIAAEKVGRTINFEKRSELDFNSALQAAVSAMNRRAFALGLANTNYINPIGLDDALQYSTAEDLYKLIRYIYEYNSDIFQTSRFYKANISYKDLNGKLYEMSVVNTNILLQDYPRIIGSKTGMTDGAGQALIFVYRLKDGKAIAVIILKSQDRFGDGEKIIQWLDK